MSKKKTLTTSIVLIFSAFLFCGSINAQHTSSKQILYTTLLDSISSKYNVFFTYSSSIFTKKKVNATILNNSSLKKILHTLELNTAYRFENLGNNYYVVYTKEDYEKLQRNLLTTEGVVLNSNGTPLVGATVVQKNSNRGTTTNNDGYFNIRTLPNHPIEISFVGCDSKIIAVSPKKIHTIILESGQQLDEVHVVGSRNKNRTTVDTPIAIDFINIENTINKSGQLNINQLLQHIIPSFNATKQSGADGTDHIIPASLRGLGPDQTLVLINGKRRHQSSLVNIFGTRGRGNSGTDLNAIPISAIQRIELLRDGASAQYGSDAIAGVINIVLKDDVDKLKILLTSGFHNANTGLIASNNEKEVDGVLYKLGVNYGAKISNAGFVNFTSEITSRAHTFRPSSANREKYGDAAANNFSLFLNSEIPLKKRSKLYANGGYNYKKTEAYAFTRAENSSRNVLAIYPNGFNPLITSEISDSSFSFGFLTQIHKWSIDLNNTFGKNNFHYLIKETLNATLEENSPTEFDAGGHQLTQNTTSIDFSKYLSEKLNGINVAFGLEYRVENYQIFAGETGSHAAYDKNGNVITDTTPILDYTTYNNNIRPGGSQGFPGYSPSNEVDRSRTNFSLYADTEIDFSEKQMLGAAIRYENYSDFGNTLNFKVTSRVKFLSFLNVRSSFSTGFRAPSLAQIYYNLSFTNFIGNTPSESLLLANNSPIARKLSIGKLKEEKAINASFGAASKISNNFNIALDSYYVAIKDRIILSGSFDATSFGIDVDNVQFFANGVDTRTVGLDVVLNWKKHFENTNISIELAGNINHMRIDKVHHESLDKEVFFGVRDRQFLLASAPKNKFNLTLNYRYKKTKTALSVTRFSSQKLIDWQISKDLSNFNNSEEERLATATDFYNAKVTTDVHFSYQVSKLVNIQIGSNNLFNIYPTVQNGFTDGGGFWDAVQMGTNGTFYYTKIKLEL
ncbi:MAG: TonB-dependent receptor [Polaribacter sp.]|nr:TonB-dependent receptor [Polaribacter sp.]